MTHDPVLIHRLRTAGHVVILTGAGVSAESGVPTFRERQSGLWQRFDAAELANAAAFRRDPELVWGWYEWRRAIVLRAQPNSAHRAIAAMAGKVPRLTLVTQNVDDLHERAGSRDVLHLHGQLAQPYCERCRRPYAFAQGVAEMPEGGRRMEPPRCEACGGRIRPGVVWFGEALPAATWQSAVDASGHADVFFCIGTSSIVQPAASLTHMASAAGAMTIQINTNAADMDAAASFALPGAAGTVLPQLISQTWDPA